MVKVYIIMENMDPRKLTVQYRTLNTIDDIIQIHQELYPILRLYHVHFLAHGHNCADESDQATVHFYWSGQHISIKVIYIENNLIAAINTVHRAFRRRPAITQCPACGDITI